jgi:protein O-GlcNAc transferase
MPPENDPQALGNALYRQGRFDEAATAYRRALALGANHSQLWNNLGIALFQLGRLDESTAALRQAIALAPADAEVHKNLAAALYRREKLDEAEAVGRRAVALRPDYAPAYINLAAILQAAGNLDEAIACHDRIAVLTPNDSAAASNRILALQLHPAYDSQRLLAELKWWNHRHARPLARAPVANRQAVQRLRIGYVSADFRDHVLGRCVLPLLREHDRRQFEIFCYANMPRGDALTERFKSHADHWRDIFSLNDRSAVELIRSDGIHILADLSLHTAGNRLPIFTHKPAPAQVAFAGYPGGTGLSAMDWRLTDQYLDPQGQTDTDYVEKSYRLPDSFWCFDPEAMEMADLEVGPPPAVNDGSITFGCLNNFCKVNEAVLALWARVLQATPGSRLRMLAPLGSARRRILQNLGDRVDFVPRQPRQAYLAEYRRIDLCLDTFPYNGHATSLEALWMGVPLVTRVGHTVLGRAGISQLSNLNLTDLIAWDDEQFVKIASALARDIGRLTELRHTLRKRMLDSPLTDAKRFARGIEEAYTKIWCEG